MNPFIALIGLCTIAAAAAAAWWVRSWYQRMLDERIEAEIEVHLPVRRRIKGLVKHGARSATEPVQEGRFGWWWIWADVREEAMGVAWTRRGARRQLQSYISGRASGTQKVRHVVIPREPKPRRRVPMFPSLPAGVRQ